MGSLFEQLNNPSFDSCNCGVKEGKFLGINPEEANGVRFPCSPLPVNGISCKHPEVQEFIDEVDGLDLETVRTVSPSVILPKFTPIITSDFFKLDSEKLDFETIGISLKDVIGGTRRIAHRLRIGRFNLNESVLKSPIFQGKKVILFLSGRDLLIESFWEYAIEKDFFSRIAGMGFFTIVTPNFSIFFGECPVIHGIATKKSLKVFDYFQKEGIRPIPHIYFSNKFEVERLINWLRKNPLINLVSINCQCYKSEDHELIKDGIKLIIQNTHQEIKFLLEGPTQKFLSDLSEFYPRFLIAIKRPSMESVSHQKLISVGAKLQRTAVRNLGSTDLINQNYREYFNHIQSNSNIHGSKILLTKKPEIVGIKR